MRHPNNTSGVESGCVSQAPGAAAEFAANKKTIRRMNISCNTRTLSNQQRRATAHRGAAVGGGGWFTISAWYLLNLLLVSLQDTARRAACARGAFIARDQLLRWSRKAVSPRGSFAFGESHKEHARAEVGTHPLRRPTRPATRFGCCSHSTLRQNLIRVFLGTKKRGSGST